MIQDSGSIICKHSIDRFDQCASAESVSVCVWFGGSGKTRKLCGLFESVINTVQPNRMKFDYSARVWMWNIIELLENRSRPTWCGSVNRFDEIFRYYFCLFIQWIYILSDILSVRIGAPLHWHLHSCADTDTGKRRKYKSAARAEIHSHCFPFNCRTYHFELRFGASIIGRSEMYPRGDGKVILVECVNPDCRRFGKYKKQRLHTYRFVCDVCSHLIRVLEIVSHWIDFGAVQRPLFLSALHFACTTVRLSRCQKWRIPVPVCEPRKWWKMIYCIEKLYWRNSMHNWLNGIKRIRW